VSACSPSPTSLQLQTTLRCPPPPGDMQPAFCCAIYYNQTAYASVRTQRSARARTATYNSSKLRSKHVYAVYALRGATRARATRRASPLARAFDMRARLAHSDAQHKHCNGNATRLGALTARINTMHSVRPRQAYNGITFFRLRRSILADE